MPSAVVPAPRSIEDERAQDTDQGKSFPPDLQKAEPEETLRMVIRQLRVIIRALQGHSRVVERSCGISAAQLWALWEMHRTPGLKVSELSRRLSIHTSTTSNLLDKLEVSGLIERHRRERDQRVVRLFVTEAGMKLLECAPAAPQGELHRALDSLDAQKLALLAETLTVIASTMRNATPRDALRPLESSND